MTSENQLRSVSKFLSFVLRHEPQSIGLTLDEAGWATVDHLLDRAQAAGQPVSRALLQRVVDTSDEKRFRFSEDGQRIRANQGHSVTVELGLAPLMPPTVLYHGTASRFLDDILRAGLEKRDRHHVHLTEDPSVTRSVGIRHGRVVLLQVDASRMARDGRLFYRSDNGVWLTDTVPASYLVVSP